MDRLHGELSSLSLLGHFYWLGHKPTRLTKYSVNYESVIFYFAAPSYPEEVRPLKLHSWPCQNKHSSLCYRGVNDEEKSVIDLRTGVNVMTLFSS
jgi:hypothetical protein